MYMKSEYQTVCVSLCLPIIRQLLLKDVKRGWVRVDNRLRVESSGDRSAAELFAHALQQNAFAELVDFDEHLEDVAKDWRNPHVLQLAQLNV